MTSISSKLSVLAILGLMAMGCQNSKIQQQREWKALGFIQPSGGTTEATQQNLLHEIDSIDRRMKEAIRRCGERNKDNDLGRYIRENYKDE